ncbi:phenylacetate--CoA ligase family protein (plasmid) [Haladaptatus sp. SPP-AMP-3]|uniref:phenylacetate--CoA ligase family protein n=1 Tax=Haladaptatus sp. SPP-AMP-3 TaxID=3121295 RepID=UPI003C2DD46E
MYELNTLKKLRIRLKAFRAKRATRSEIEARQKRRLEELLTFVVRQSRFYKRQYRGVERPITTLEALPPVTKPMLMDNFDDVVTDTAVTRDEVDAFVGDPSKIGHRFLGQYPVWTTSGTTGRPGIFLQDEYALTATDAVGDRWSLPAFLDIETMHKLVRHNFKTAEIAVTGGHYAAASGVALFQRERPFLRTRIRLFSPKRPLSELVADLNAYQPAILVGYATVLKELAHEQADGRLQLTPAFITPSGESVSDVEKGELSRAFDCPVRENYGATEFYSLASECDYGNLHANTDWVVLEPVDENYQPVERGTPSETVLLTNLANRIQPIVRYDLGDSVTMYDEPCQCGSPFPVIEIEGRQGDVLHFDTEEEGSVPIFPLAISSVVEEIPGVRRTQIVQTDSRSLRVRLAVTDDTDEQAVWEETERKLGAFLNTQSVTDIHLERGAEPPRRDPKSGKFRHVWAEGE